jgi:hypothetical protein
MNSTSSKRTFIIGSFGFYRRAAAEWDDEIVDQARPPTLIKSEAANAGIVA